MKFVVLLALAGLANCHTTLLGGDRARDVTIEYTYLDDHGKEVTVEVKADNLELDLTKDSKLSLKKASSFSAPSASSVARATGPSLELEPAVPRFVQVQPPHPVSAPAPQLATVPSFRTVSAQPVAPRLAPAVRLVDLDDFDAPKTRFVQVEAPRAKVETRFVQVEAPRAKVETRFVQVEAPKPKIETRFLQVEAPRANVETRFVQVEAPRPQIETRFVEADFPEPDFETRFVQVQSPRRQEALTHFALAKPAGAPRSAPTPPATTHFFTVPGTAPSAPRLVSGIRRHGFRSDDNNSVEE